MKALLIAENKDVKELLSFQITSKFPVLVKECMTPKEAADALAKDPMSYSFVVSVYDGKDSPLLSFMREALPEMPLILFYDPPTTQPEGALVNGLKLVGSIESPKLSDGLVPILSDFLKNTAGDGDPPEEYCPIRTNLLIRVSPLKSDIFIRLSREKFVKLFRTGDEFDENDLKKYYEAKGVEYMYLKRKEIAEFLEKFKQELDKLLARTDLKQEEAMEASEMSHEAVAELVHKIGFTQEVQEIAKKNVELALKVIGSNPKLADVISKITKEGNYLSQHSTVLAHVSCCVAKEMEWGSESTFSKLALASFMHDISLTNAEIAKIGTLRELEDRKADFSSEEVKNYHLHPAKSADVVRSFQEIPADVDVIVMQHHERPNGGGFPRGLAHNYVAPLSALFIVAHDLTQAILEKGESFNLPLFVDERKSQFNQGNFKKVLAALEKMKL